MTIAFQLAVFALIATSSILVISVPVVFVSPLLYTLSYVWRNPIFVLQILSYFLNLNRIRN